MLHDDHTQKVKNTLIALCNICIREIRPMLIFTVSNDSYKHMESSKALGFEKNKCRHFFLLTRSSLSKLHPQKSLP